MKRMRLSLVCIVLLIILATLPAAANEIVLKYWRHGDPNVGGISQYSLDVEAIKRFEADHPGVKVEIVTAPDTPKLMEKVLTAVVGGVGPDVLNTSSSDFITLADSGVLRPVDPISLGYGSFSDLEEAFLPGALDGYSYRGKTYGIPFELSAYGFWINSDHFRESGIDPESNYPRTWSDVAAVGQKLTRQQIGRISRQGYCPLTMYNIWGTVGWQSMINQMGSSVLNEEQTESYINSPAAIRGLQMRKDYVYKYKISDPAVKIDPLELFGTNQASMIDYGGSWAIPILEQDYPDADYKIIPYPRWADAEVDTGAITYGFGKVVFASSQHPDLSWELVKYLHSQPQELIKLGIFQPVKGWFETPEAQSFPYFAYWMQELGKGTYHIQSPRINEIAKIMMKAQDEVLLNNADVQTELDKAKVEMDKVLNR